MCIVCCILYVFCPEGVLYMLYRMFCVRDLCVLTVLCYIYMYCVLLRVNCCVCIVCCVKCCVKLCVLCQVVCVVCAVLYACVVCDVYSTYCTIVHVCCVFLLLTDSTISTVMHRFSSEHRS